MERDDDNGSKRQPWRCCFCRSTREHRCYMCFCGKCPPKKLPLVTGVKDQAGKVPSIIISEKLQPVETSNPGGAMTDVPREGEIISPCPSVVKNQRGNDAVANQNDESPSFWNVLAEKETRGSGNQVGWTTRSGSALGWNESRDYAAGPIASWEANPWNEPRGTRAAENQNDGRSSKARDGSASMWDVLADKERRASGNQVGWAAKAGSASSWNRRHDNEPRGNPVFMYSNAQDGSERVSQNPHFESGPRWSYLSEKRTRGDREGWTHGIEDLSSTVTKKRRRFQEIVANTTEDRSSEAVLLKPHVNSESYQVSQPVKEKRRFQELRADRTRDEFKPISCDPPSGSCSRRDVEIVKDARGNANCISRNGEVTAMRAGDGSCSTRFNWGCFGSKGTKRTGGGSGKLYNFLIHSGSSSEALKLKETTGRSISETIPSYNIGFGGDKQYLHPSVASQRHAKPSPVIRSGENSSTKRKLCSSPELDRVGPALAKIWKGKFEVPDFPGDEISEAFLAHPAANVSRKAYEFACQIKDRLIFNIHPRYNFWPDIFGSKFPDNRDVALYFYPQQDPRSKKMYAKLLKLLESQELMLRSIMGGVELLVFSSKLLHPKFQILEGNMYMWGVFRKVGGKPEPAEEFSNSTPAP